MMRKRVIKSLIVGALTVMITSFVILTPIFFYTFGKTAVNKVYSEIEDNIIHVKPLAQMSLSFNTSKLNRLFNESMSQFAYFTKLKIIFMDDEGNVIWANDIPNEKKMNEYSKIALESMKNKEKIKSEGLLDGLYGKNTLTIGEYIENEQGQKSWLVFCSANSPGIYSQYRLVFYEVLLVELITLSFVTVFMFLFSKSITVPLNKINNTLKSFAKGDFKKRVEYKEKNELGEIAENINKMADSIENLEKMRQDFVSDISHELRTPMTSISGFIEGILDGTVSENDRDKYLKIALSESKRLTNLANDLISLTKIDDLDKTLNKSEFDMEELAKLVLIKFENEITKKDIEVDFNISDEEFFVYADKDRYTQVLTNLIHNAVKFTPSYGHISIKLSKEDKKCVVSIKNTGYGIPKDKLNFIWERFYKADDSRSSDKSGIGIGLYIVKKIIDFHGENIYVTSVENEYTEFAFTAKLI